MGLIIEDKEVTAIEIDGKEVVQITNSDGDVLWEKALRDYFYFEDRSGSENALTMNYEFTDPTHTMEDWVEMEYSYDKVVWNDWDFTQTLTIPANGKVYLRSDCGALDKNVPGGTYQAYHRFSSTGSLYAGGNIVSLIDSTIEQTDLNTGRTYEHLFQDMTTLVAVSPTLCDTITSLSGTYNFNRTWFGCTNLENTPDFTGITNATSSAFNSTFRGTAVADASNFLPNLTTISQANTFNSTFRDCTNLEVPLDISSVVLASNATNTVITNLYYNCQNIAEAYTPNISDWSSLSETNGWLHNVAASGTLYVPTKTLADTIPTDSENGCPSGWDKVDLNGKLYATPTISQSNNTISITAVGISSNCDIYYTTNGTTPTSSSTRYTSPFAITENCTVKAIVHSTNTDVTDSDVVSFTATFKQTVATPTASCTNNVVTMSCVTSGATILYSTNSGSTWSTYSSAITISQTTTYSIKATKSGMIDSSVTTYTATYVAPKLPTPNVSHSTVSGTYYQRDVNMSTSGVSGVTYYITTNLNSEEYVSPSNPTTSSPSVSGIGSDSTATKRVTTGSETYGVGYTVVKVMGVKSGYTNSDVETLYMHIT